MQGSVCLHELMLLQLCCTCVVAQRAAAALEYTGRDMLTLAQCSIQASASQRLDRLDLEDMRLPPCAGKHNEDSAKS